MEVPPQIFLLWHWGGERKVKVPPSLSHTSLAAGPGLDPAARAAVRLLLPGAVQTDGSGGCAGVGVYI